MTEFTTLFMKDLFGYYDGLLNIYEILMSPVITMFFVIDGNFIFFLCFWMEEWR